MIKKKTKRAQACDIPIVVRDAVYSRDNKCCIICGSPNAKANAHYIPRSHGGLGIEQNIVTLCLACIDGLTKPKSVAS